MRMTRVRIKATGQVTDVVPDVARAMILGGTAEEVKSPESMAVTPTAERAVAPAHNPSRKPIFSRKRAG